VTSLVEGGAFPYVLVDLTLRVYMDTQSEEGATVTLPFPWGEEQVFRYRAMEDILELLIRNPFREFTVSELQSLTNNGSKTTTNAVNLLEDIELVTVDQDGRSKDVSLNRNRVTIPDDPLFAIPQDEFRRPIQEFLDWAESDVAALSAVVLFGSVARGEADRQSDIDLWLLVDDNDQLLKARREATQIGAELENKRFEQPTGTPDQQGDRYEFEVLVESTETALSHGEDIPEILTEGIVLRDSEELAEVKEAVLSNQGAE